MLDTINGIDVVLVVIATAGWTAWRIERASSPVYRLRQPNASVRKAKRTMRENDAMLLRTERLYGKTTEVYDHERQGL